MISKSTDAPYRASSCAASPDVAKGSTSPSWVIWLRAFSTASSISDWTLGEVVVAYVAVRPAAAVTVEELEALCAERLAKYKRPVAIEILGELPKNAIGKIDKRPLCELARRRPA